jgi:flagellar basal body-associated protein FliL
MPLKLQVEILTAWWGLRRRLAQVDLRSERGDVYSSTIMIAVAVTIALAVGGVLLFKFVSKAESIDTNTPIAP